MIHFPSISLKKIKLRGKSVLITIIAILLILITIPILIFGYASSNLIIKNANAIDSEYAYFTLESAMGNIDKYLSQVKDSAMLTFLELNSCNLSPSYLNSSEYSKLKVIQKISNLCKTNDNIVLVMFVFGEDYIISTDLGFQEYSSVDALYKEILESSGEYGEWYHMDITRYNTEGKKSSTTNTIICQLKYPPNMSLIISIDGVAIQDLLEQNNLPEAFQILLDSNGNIITQTSETYFTKDEAYSFLSNNVNIELDSQTVTIKNSEYNVTCFNAETDGWQCVSFTPVEALYRQANYVKRLVVWSSLICLLFGCAMLMLVYLEFYKPLLNLQKKMLTVTKNTLKRGNEFSSISNAINVLVSDNSVIKDRLEKNYALLKENVLKDYLEGNTEILKDGGIMVYKEYLNIETTAAGYEVCVVKCNCNENKEEQGFKEKVFALLEIFLKEAYDLYEIVYTSQGPTVIIQHSGQQANSLDIGAIMSPFIENANSLLDSSCTVGVGYASSFDRLHTAYADARFALNYSFVEGDNRIYSTNEIKPYVEQSGQSVVMKSELEIYQIMMNKNEKTEICISSSFMSDIAPFIEKHSFGYRQVKTIYEKYIMTILKYVLENNIPIPNKFELGAITNAEYLQVMKSNIDALGLLVSQFEETDHNVRIIQSVADYIDDHYNEDLTLESMAEKVFISPNYLSRLFKQHYGLSFSRYLLQKKIHVAEFMLVASDKKIQEIALEVGYYNLNSFTKIFKRYKGLSPSEYRRRIGVKAMSEEPSSVKKVIEDK